MPDHDSKQHTRKKRMSKRARAMLRTRRAKNSESPKQKENRARRNEKAKLRYRLRVKLPPIVQANLESIESQPGIDSTNARAREASEIIAPEDQRTLEAVLDADERAILRLANVERVDVGEIAEAINRARGVTCWDTPQVCKLLARARAKLTKAGELEAARSNDYTAQDIRLRYDSIIATMRAELKKLDSPNVVAPGGPGNLAGDPREALLAPLRVKLLKQIADTEKIRDEALSLLGGSKPSSGPSFKYVSHLRPGAPTATANGNGSRETDGPEV